MTFMSANRLLDRCASGFSVIRTWRERLRLYYGDVPAFRKVVRCADALFVMGVLGLAAYGACSLPYDYPPKTPAAESISYQVGFDNRIAMMVVLAAIAVLALRSFAWQSPALEKIGATLCDRPGRTRVAMPRSVLLLMLLIYAGLGCAIIHCAIPFEEYGQGVYSALRLNLALRYHLRPFLDIQWNYGPLFFYVPLLAMKSVSAMGGSTQIGFGIGYLIIQFASLLILFYFIDHLSIKVAYRVLLCCLFALFGFDLSFALQGAALRFLGPFFALLVLHRFLLKLGSATSLRSILSLAGVCLLCNLAVLSLGAEMGIPHAIAQILYCAYGAMRGDRSRVYGAAATLLGVPVFMALVPGSTQMMMRFSGGFGNTPLYPSIFAISYLVCIFWVVPNLIGSSLAAHPGPNAPLALTFAAMIVFQMPYALGRADCGHLYGGGFAATILALAMISKVRPRDFTACVTLLVLISAIAYPLANNNSFIVPQLVAGLSGRPTPPVAPSPLVAALQLEKYPSIATPFGIDRDTKAFLVQTGRFFVEYDPDFVSVCTESDIRRKIAGLANACVIIVPKGVPALKRVTDEGLLKNWELGKRQSDESWSEHLSLTCLFPVHYKAIRMPYDPMLETARRVASMYIPIGSADDWVLMKRK